MICVKQLPGKTSCAWHKENQENGKIYKENEILTSNMCPIMFHTLYPYFLGVVFGAKYVYNKQGDCQVCCPAEKGVDVIVKVRHNDGKFEKGVPHDWRDVIHAEVVNVHGLCDYGHKVGDRLLFPTCMRTKYMCPAGVNNIFPFLNIEIPKCINLKRLRCPDWLENVYYEVYDNEIQPSDEINFNIMNHYSSLIIDKEKYGFLHGINAYNLLNGENPYQTPSNAFSTMSSSDNLSLLNFKQISGNKLCYVNMADADCILRTICMMSEAFLTNIESIPYLCIASKHGNACGVGVSKSNPLDSIENALFGDPLSIWGGEIITNFEIDDNIANSLFKSDKRKLLLNNDSWMLDLILSPSFTKDAINILSKREERKLLENKELYSPKLNKHEFTYRCIRGGFLRQPSATYILDIGKCNMNRCDMNKCNMNYTDNEISALIIAWAVSFSSNHGGNEISLSTHNKLLSAGGGASTIESVINTFNKAMRKGHNTKNSAFSANAFFPFLDAPELIHSHDVSIGCVPSGGKHESEIRNFFCDNGMKIVYLPDKIRGFNRH